MPNAITDSHVRKTLERLYADSGNDSAKRARLGDVKPNPHDPRAFFTSARELYLAVNPEFGNLLYALVRGTRAKSVVEFGTSFGISTIFLAAGVKDNGGGKVVTTEYLAEKSERARMNLQEAGLAESVEFQVGDALETLKASPPRAIDLVMLDGAKNLYLPILKLLEPEMRPGAIVAADNTDQEGAKEFLTYVRDPSNGYLTCPIGTNGKDGLPRQELAVRI